MPEASLITTNRVQSSIKTYLNMSLDSFATIITFFSYKFDNDINRENS